MLPKTWAAICYKNSVNDKFEYFTDEDLIMPK